MAKTRKTLEEIGLRIASIRDLEKRKSIEDFIVEIGFLLNPHFDKDKFRAFVGRKAA